MKEKGRLTAADLRKHLEEITGSEDNNVKGYFDLHPDSADALVLDPALALYSGVGSGSEKIKPYWECLPEIARKRACGRWKKGRLVNISWMLGQCTALNEGLESLNKVVDQAFAADQKKKKSLYLTREHLLNQSFAPSGLSGRAPYSRSVMRETVEFVLSTNRHPAETSKAGLEAGPLYRSKNVRSEERKISIPNLTNNHLIRQRLDILIRLVDDILAEYAENDSSRVTDILVEVATDLQTYSGLSAKEMQGELTKRLSHFKSAVKKLEEDAPDLQMTGSLIRKCRIAMDMDWQCPFTGKRYSAHQLPEMEREHVIPYADRPTNSLDALVLTFPWVNGLKGRRTAITFINDMQDDQRFLSPKAYKEHVDNLKLSKKETYPEDYRRQSNRKKLMLVEKYETKEHGFTPGALTQTSHLNRLSASQLEKKFVDPITNEPMVRIHSIPGQVTAETRKAWRLIGTLAQACPDILGVDNKPKNKTEIRNITHLHHALDAVVLGLTHYYLPGSLPGQVVHEKGAIWSAMLKRNKSEAEQALLMTTGMFTKHYRKSANNGIGDGTEHGKQMDVHLLDIPKSVKNKLADKLAECRVFQHVPSDQSGAKLEETTWRYLCDHQGQAVLLQRISRDALKPDGNKATFGWNDLEIKKAGQKLLDDNLILEALSDKQVKLIKRGHLKIAKVPKRSLVGLSDGKLKDMKAVRVVSLNYGIAMGVEPKLIPFHQVPCQLKELRIQNAGKLPPIIRRGRIIKVEGGTWKGVWRVTSVKESEAYGLSVDLAHPHMLENAKGNAKVINMIRDGLSVFYPPLTGMIL
jgi:CRISPR-associated endonuclease Csn1